MYCHLNSLRPFVPLQLLEVAAFLQIGNDLDPARRRLRFSYWFGQHLGRLDQSAAQLGAGPPRRLFRKLSRSQSGALTRGHGVPLVKPDEGFGLPVERVQRELVEERGSLKDRIDLVPSFSPNTSPAHTRACVDEN